MSVKLRFCNVAKLLCRAPLYSTKCIRDAFNIEVTIVRSEKSRADNIVTKPSPVETASGGRTNPVVR
ncbi:hypothetical protein AEM42_13745 [Betaproteobacteria bacterium UKL13-2]|nr:hypothetical protein AEM42_13745 [Betaproteobacteria bacterium UKL13-2]